MSVSFHNSCTIATSIPGLQTSIVAIVVVASLLLTSSRLEAWQKVSEPTTTKRYQEFVSGIMDLTDTDGNGLLDSKEQEANYRRLFDNADSDGDGSVSPQEILDQVANGKKRPAVVAAKTEASSMPEKHDSWRVKTSVLRLPNSFAEKQILSLSDIFQKMSIEQSKEKIEEGQQQGVTVVDQFEMEVLESKKSKLNLGGSVTMSTGRSHHKNGKTKQVATGSTISLQPKNTSNGVLLEFDYSATMVLSPEAKKSDAADPLVPEQDDSLVTLELKSAYRFKKKNATAVNVYSGGHHFLVVINIEPL